MRALSLSFSNTVQLGIPVVTAVFGTTGLAILIDIITLQSLVLLTTGTVLIERTWPEAAGRQRIEGHTARRALGTTVFDVVGLEDEQTADGLLHPDKRAIGRQGAAEVALDLRDVDG